jgi:crotonobetainyl-CoA:carnitine CoA-transferase CaiB-like acyl-CoA transferase
MTAEELFHRAQAKGLLWASVRMPEENITDPHFQARGTFQPLTVAGRVFHFPVSVATDGNQPLTRFAEGAPGLGEHTREVLGHLGLSEMEMNRLAEEGVL